MNDKINATRTAGDVPPSLYAKLPLGTDLGNCIITTYGELYADHDITEDWLADIELLP